MNINNKNIAMPLSLSIYNPVIKNNSHTDSTMMTTCAYTNACHITNLTLEMPF